MKLLIHYLPFHEYNQEEDSHLNNFCKIKPGTLFCSSLDSDVGVFESFGVDFLDFLSN
jgi:hypothetical protein